MNTSTVWLLYRIAAMLYKVQGKLKAQEETLMALQDTINALIAKVQAENTTIDSAVALIAQLQASQTNPDPVDPATVQALSDAIDAGAAKLAAAVPAQPAPAS